MIHNQVAWNEYEFSLGEPTLPRGYPTPEEEGRLLDDSWLLKRRVWRRMKKLSQESAYDKHNKRANRELHLMGRGKL